AKQNSLLSVLLKAKFDLSLSHKFNRTDFYPKPNVDVVILKIHLLEKPPITDDLLSTFYDFVTYGFSQFEPNILLGLKKILSEHKITKLAKQHSFSTDSKPSQLSFQKWLVLFHEFMSSSNNKQKNTIKNSFNELQKQQQGLQKTHRTRLARCQSS